MQIGARWRDGEIQDVCGAGSGPDISHSEGQTGYRFPYSDIKCRRDTAFSHGYSIGNPAIAATTNHYRDVL